MLGRRTKAIFRGADYSADLNGFRGGDVDWFSDIRRLGYSRKRRVKGGSWREDRICGSTRYDEDYVDFLLDLEDLARLRGIEDDEDDPEYAMFLDTKVVESSYEVHQSAEHAVRFPTMYKGKNTTSKKVDKRKNQRLGRHDNSQDKRNRVVPAMYGENNISKKTEKRKNQEFGRDDYSRSKRNRVEEVPRIKNLSRGLNVTQKETIPRQRKKTKVPCSPRNYDAVIILDSSEDEDVHFQEKRATIGEFIKGQITRNCDAVINLDSSEDEDFHIQEKGATVGEVIKREKLVSLRSDDFQEDQSLDVFGVSRSAPKKLALQKFVVEEQSSDAFGESSSSPKKLVLQEVVIDEVYNLFLENLKEKGELCVYKYGDTEQVYYESLPGDQRLAIAAHSSKQPIIAVGASSDQLKRDDVNAVHSKTHACNHRLPPLPPKVPVSIQKRPTLKKPTHTQKPAPASRLKTTPLDLQHALNFTHRVPPRMKEKLLAILSMPYNQQEHDQLWKELTDRSAVLSHRDSRSGGSHRPGQMGRSLLDHYPDLQSEIEKVKSDRPKVLNLLRMLSYYIKKLPCGNICMPWLDNSLLTILPGTA